MIHQPLDRCDVALLAAFILTAALGTWNSCLLINDGAFLLSVGWLGDAWDLYFNQLAEPSVSTLFAFGPQPVPPSALYLSSVSSIPFSHFLSFPSSLSLL